MHKLFFPLLSCFFLVLSFYESNPWGSQMHMHVKIFLIFRKKYIRKNETLFENMNHKLSQFCENTFCMDSKILRHFKQRLFNRPGSTFTAGNTTAGSRTVRTLDTTAQLQRLVVGNSTTTAERFSADPVAGGGHFTAGNNSTRAGKSRIATSGVATGKPVTTPKSRKVFGRSATVLPTGKRKLSTGLAQLKLNNYCSDITS